MADKVIGDYDAAITIDGTTHFLLIQPGSASTAYKKISRSVLLGVSGQPVDISTTQTLSNKVIGNTNTVTLSDTLFTIQDNSDSTKQARFQLSGLTTATTRTYTLPNRSDTLVDLGSSQTLTSKTLTSPIISGGSIDNSTVTVDAISGHTDADSGSVYGVTVTNGAISSSAAIGDGIIVPNGLVAGSGATWDPQSWTPSYNNLDPGDGTVVALYTQIGKVVEATYILTFGASTTIGTNPSVSLPVTAATSPYSTNVVVIGQGFYEDTGVIGYPLQVEISSSTTEFRWEVWKTDVGTNLTSAAVTATVPFTPNAGDKLQATIRYWAA